MLFFKKNRVITLLSVAVLLIMFAAAMRWRSSTIQAGYSQPRASRMSTFPKLFLWAWERPEHLEFINPREVGVAYLAETIYLRGDKLVTRPRLQPLDVPIGTTLIAVVRIESARDVKPSLSVEQRQEVVDSLTRIAGKQNTSALQIDFDATQSERKFYQDLLGDVRARLPESMPLSMTALASWCIFDNWLDDVPVDEAVPMFFQMGIDQHRITDYLNAGGKLRSSRCQQSVGISMAETGIPVFNGARVYVFNSQPWSELAVRQVLERSRNETIVP